MSKIRIKSSSEIAAIRRAGEIAANCLTYLTQYVVPGVTTNELNKKAAWYIGHFGGIPAPLNYKGFPKETCISVNEVICHGIPNDKKLKEGDILNIDVTVKKDGYYGDTSRMFKVGKVSQEAEDLIKITKECLNIGISQVYPGNRFGNIGYAIASYAGARGYSVVYQFCGHGTGIEFHEEPSIPHIAHKNTGPIMKPGMVFTIEPMINLGEPEAIINEADGWTATTVDKKLSAQFEHTIAVTKKGYDILTRPSGTSNYKHHLTNYDFIFNSNEIIVDSQ